MGQISELQCSEILQQRRTESPGEVLAPKHINYATATACVKHQTCELRDYVTILLPFWFYHCNSKKTGFYKNNRSTIFGPPLKHYLFKYFAV